MPTAQSNTLTFTIEEEILIDNNVTWTIGNKEVKSLTINNKEVASIIRTSDDAILYGKSTPTEKPTPTITFTTSNATPSYGTSITLSGTLSVGKGASVKIYDGDTLLTTKTTGANGTFSYSMSNLSVGSHTLQARFEGNEDYNSVTSSNVTVTVNKATPTISLSANSNSIGYGETLILSGTLSVGSGKSVSIYDGNTLLITMTTTTNGAFTYANDSLSVGSHTIQARYSGDNIYNSVNSSNVIVTVNSEAVNNNSVVEPITLNIDFNSITQEVENGDMELIITLGWELDENGGEIYSDNQRTISEYQSFINSFNSTVSYYDDPETHPILYFDDAYGFVYIGSEEYSEGIFYENITGSQYSIVNNTASITIDVEDLGMGYPMLFAFISDIQNEQDIPISGTVVENPNGTILNFTTD